MTAPLGLFDTRACWADPTGTPNSWYSCPFEGTGPLGLCPKHATEILPAPHEELAHAV